MNSNNITLEPPKIFLTQVDDLIEEYLKEPRLLLLLAKKLHLSSSQVYRKIKQKSGYSPSIYIRKKRLIVARKWIKQSDASITEIAFQTGFQNLPYFSRCFLAEFGISPSKFRVTKNWGYSEIQC